MKAAKLGATPAFALIISLISCGSFVLLNVGCGGKGEDSSSEETAFETGEDSSSDDRAQVVTPSNQDEQSPANSSAAALTVDAAPGEVVSAYIDALNKGNLTSAEKLLTDVARTETRRAAMMPQPAWSDSATYIVGEARFATERAVRAELPTEWVERDANGASADFQIVWMLFKQPEIGWRIYGMKTHFVPGGQLIFLNFENPEDMVTQWEKGVLEMDRLNEIRETAENRDSVNR